MEMDISHRRATGAFYTPAKFADMMVERLAWLIGNDVSDYVFYDPAGGEGALIEAIWRRWEHAECYASTLEAEDVLIMREKGIFAFQHDFINDDLRNNKDCECRYLLRAFADGKVIVVTNPPFINVKGLGNKWCTNNAVGVFLLRLVEELHPKLIVVWSKVDIWQSVSSMQRWMCRFLPWERDCGVGFMVPSSEWVGLSSGWALCCSYFYGGVVLPFNRGFVSFDAVERGGLVAKKKFFAPYSWVC